MYIYICLFTNPNTSFGCITKSILKQSVTGWNREFSFS